MVTKLLPDADGNGYLVTEQGWLIKTAKLERVAIFSGTGKSERQIRVEALDKGATYYAQSLSGNTVVGYRRKGARNLKEKTAD